MAKVTKFLNPKGEASMGDSEHLIKLAPEDTAELEKHKLQNLRGCSWVLIIVAVLLIAAPMGYTLLARIDKPNEPLTHHPLLLAIDVMAVVIGALILYKTVKTLNVPVENHEIAKDLQEGHKKVITRRVDNQHITSSRSQSSPFGDPGGAYGSQDPLVRLTSVESIDMGFVLTLGGSSYAASEELYMAVKPGDLIETHVAPNSGHIFYHRLITSGRIFPPQSLTPEK